MTLIDMLRPEQRQRLRQMRYRIYNREYMRPSASNASCCASAWTCRSRRAPAAAWCTPATSAAFTRRRWWLLKHAFNDAEVSIAAMLAEHASDNDTRDDAPGAIPVLDELSDLGDPCLRW